MNVSKFRQYFKFFEIMPLVMAILCALGFFVWGIVDATVIYQYHGYKSYTYGVMGLETKFGVWIVWMLIGIVPTVLTYYLTSVLVSYRMLVIHNLEAIKFSSRKIESSLGDVPQDTNVQTVNTIAPTVSTTVVKIPQVTNTVAQTDATDNSPKPPVPKQSEVVATTPVTPTFDVVGQVVAPKLSQSQQNRSQRVGELTINPPTMRKKYWDPMQVCYKGSDVVAEWLNDFVFELLQPDCALSKDQARDILKKFDWEYDNNRILLIASTYEQYHSVILELLAKMV